MVKKWSPNALTASRFVLGVVSIAATLNNSYTAGAGLVFLAALYNHWHNRVARRLNNAADCARRIDMLADLLVFAAAPAVLYFNTLFADYELTGFLLAVIYPVACVLRLSRFSLNGASSYSARDSLAVAGPLVSCLALTGYLLPLAVHVILLLLISVAVLTDISNLNLRHRNEPKK